MTKRYKVIYAGVMLLFATYLIFATDIVLQFMPDSIKTVKCDLSDFPSSGRTHAGIDIVQGDEGLFQKVELTGWAFTETNVNNDNKNAQIILANEKKAYLIPNTTNGIRQDIQVTFRKTVPIVGNNHGFTAKFTTLNIDDGIYYIWIYNKENEENYGLVNTGVRYVKAGNKFYKYPLQKKEKLGKLVVDNEMKVIFDSVRIKSGLFEGKYLTFEGWGYRPKLLKSSPNSVENTYLQIKYKDGTQFYLEGNRSTRQDIAEAMDNEAYLQSGIFAEYDEEVLKPGTFTIQLVVEENGIYYVSDQREAAYRKNENGTIDYIDLTGTSFESANIVPVDNTPFKTASVTSNIRMAMDSILNANWYLQLQGWEVLMEDDEKVMQMYVGLQKKNQELEVYEVLNYERPDIAQAFGDQYLNSGIRARVPIFGMNQEPFKLYFFVKTQNNLVVSDQVLNCQLNKDSRLEILESSPE